MATETNETTTDPTDTTLERPEFRGCAVCYSVELAVYAVRKARR
ncbi:hypothetical protein [Haloplanus sp.]|nr:hypothetical protein [Haloplanus sp.]